MSSGLSRADMGLLVACLSNRAAARLAIQDAYGALCDAREVLDLDGVHCKARYRQGLALTALGHHTEAVTALEAIIHAPGAAASAREEAEAQLPRVLRRLDQAHGVYEMGVVGPMLTNPAERDEVADYIGPLVVKRSPAMGRGTYLTADVRRGPHLCIRACICLHVAHSGHPSLLLLRPQASSCWPRKPWPAHSPARISWD